MRLVILGCINILEPKSAVRYKQMSVIGNARVQNVLSVGFKMTKVPHDHFRMIDND